MNLPRSAWASSGWIPAWILLLATVATLVVYGTAVDQVTLFGAYVAAGLALPGTLMVRAVRGRSAHISEDVALGLAFGYCVEVATYIPARAIGLPLLVGLWPLATLVAFAVVPRLRRHWRGSGERAPVWWSWSLAAMLGYLLVYSAGTYFATHHLSGQDTPYVDMPYHLALIAELRHHVPPDIPYVAGVSLAYHWFFYAEAAATSWMTGIEPVTLLYRLSGLPMFVTFVVLTAAAARRLTAVWGTGPLAIAIALFGTVAAPYRWTGAPVVDTDTLAVTWISPTNLFGLALFSAVIVVFLDLLRSDATGPRRRWLLIAVLVLGIAGAKANLLPVLIGGLTAVTVGFGISRRRIHGPAAIAMAMAVLGLVGATVLLFHGKTGGLVIGLESLRTFRVAEGPGAAAARGVARLVVPIATLGIALVLWALLWGGTLGLRARARWRTDPQVLLLLGICLSALAATTFFAYPGTSQNYYLKGAAGAFGILTSAGIATMFADRVLSRRLLLALAIAAVAGVGSSIAIAATGPLQPPHLASTRLVLVVLAMLLPVVALVAVSILGYALARLADRRIAGLRGATLPLVVALAMGFSAPHAIALTSVPFENAPLTGDTVPADGIAAARWLRDHSDLADVVATDLHCRPVETTPGVCDARNFWVAAYTERHVLVEGWAYTTANQDEAIRRHVPIDALVPFWDPALLAANDLAFTHPSAKALGALRDDHGVRWLFTDLTKADPAALAADADLRYRLGDFAVYRLR